MDPKFSYYPTIASKAPKAITESKFYQLIENGFWRDKIEQLRAASKEDQKELKGHLPCVTTSALCNGGHQASNVVSHSGLLCLDFDKGDHLNVKNFSQLKEMARFIPYVRFCALSCRGEGFFMVIALERTERHSEQARAIASVFAKIGLKADPTCCDITRTRFVSYDPHPYCNLTAPPFPYILDLMPKTSSEPMRPTMATASQARARDEGEEWRNVNKCLDEAERRGVKLCDCHSSYYKVAYAFSHRFGESGRALFHRYCATCGGCTEAKCNRTYNYQMNARASPEPTLATFFGICKAKAITYAKPSNRQSIIDELFTLGQTSIAQP